MTFGTLRAHRVTNKAVSFTKSHTLPDVLCTRFPDIACIHDVARRHTLLSADTEMLPLIDRQKVSRRSHRSALERVCKHARSCSVNCRQNSRLISPLSRRFESRRRYQTRTKRCAASTDLWILPTFSPSILVRVKAALDGLKDSLGCLWMYKTGSGRFVSVLERTTRR